ncbi:MAG: lycopene cyclase family protein [Myxococcota bacterium]
MKSALVIGSGPAGWLAAGTCAQEGYQTTLVAPDPRAPFTPTYCSWLDDVPLPYREVMAQVWPFVELYTGNERPALDVRREYALFDNGGLAELLHRRADAVEVLAGTIDRLHEDSGKSYAVGTVGNAAFERGFDLVIDASGRPGRFAANGPQDVLTAQTALGVFLRPPPGQTRPPPVLMDFRGAEDDLVPTFGYLLPMPDGTLLVEETVLAGRPPVPPEDLREALERRLTSYRVQDWEVVRTERVFIPMGGPHPEPDARAVTFGGAAGMGHPATGYLVAPVLRSEGRLRKGLRDSRTASTSAQRIESVRAALWTRRIRATRRLHLQGLELLLDMDRRRMGGFFSSFFAAPRWCWTGYLRTDSHPWRVMGAMSATFLLLSRRDRPWLRAAYARVVTTPSLLDG